ncbi:hypothetical protein BDC45DRAFT_578248 [Circinella umbellata]|nr:hypothetical protein BDC45DRAFT_578248 [Circinella umbellata]
MTCRLLVLFFVLLSLLFNILSQYASSFCIYNEIEGDVELAVKQIHGVAYHIEESHRFKQAHIRPYEKECCPYDNFTCNLNKQRNNTVGFWISVSKNRGITHGERHYINCTAGGFIQVLGTVDDTKFNVFDENGSLIE